MIGLLLRNKGLFFDIILVVGGILAFTFWDPLGIFNNTKLRATANMVTGVRDIGQLVTAEYYGEVISSWKEFKLTEFPEDTITYKAEDLFVNLKFALSDPNIKFRKLDTEKIKKELHNKYGKSFYYKFLTFLGEELGFKLNKIFDEKDSDLKRNYENKIWRKLHNEIAITHKTLKRKYKNADGSLIDEEYANYLSEVPEFIDGFYKYYGFLTKKHLESGSNRRKEIVFIGRGWVKAGFDFGKLNEGNFMYDEANKSVHFFGIKPVILDTDINPWFIPERKVKGFELVNYSGKVNFEDAKAVKKQCKEKLLEQARKADIVKKAMENGEETLKNFFSLILDEPDIKVRFHTHPFDLHYAMIAADTLVDINEAIFIQELYEKQMKKIDKAKKERDGEKLSLALKENQLMKIFINQLKQLNFIDSGFHFNYYSIAAAEILKDTFHISICDRQKLIDLRDKLNISTDSLHFITKIVLKNPLWFDEDGYSEGTDFRDEFNHTMNALETHAISIEVDNICDVWNSHFDKKEYTLFLKEELVRQGDSILFTDNDSVIYKKCDSTFNRLNFFSDIKYDLEFYGKLKDSLSADTTVYILNQYYDTVSYTQRADTLNRAEMKVVIEVEKRKAIEKNQVNPVMKVAATIEEIVERIRKKNL